MPQAKTPTDPPESCHMRFFCAGFRHWNNVAICINPFYEAGYPFRKYGLPCGLPASLCTLHLIVTNFDATLGMGGWLGLTQQGLSPCKKYKTSWRSSAKRYRIIELAHVYFIYFKTGFSPAKYHNLSLAARTTVPCCSITYLLDGLDQALSVGFTA